MITFPKKPKIIKREGNLASFEIEACYPGYGLTLGNAMRRVLLSSLPGAAVVSVKIKGVHHEFSTIPHTAEDVIQIILNLKQVRFKLHGQEPVKVWLKAKGEKQVTAADIKTTAQLEVVNPKAYLATLTDKKASLEMEIEVDHGLGYSPIEERKKGKLEVGKIAVDAVFSPVRRVNYSIEHMRVGERTDYDRLKINLETDGTITPEQAFLKASKIILDHFEVLNSMQEKKLKKKKIVSSKVKKAKAKPKAKKEAAGADQAKIKLIDLKISSQTSNLLNNAGIKTAAGLVKKKEADLEKIEGLGKKRVVEIKRALGKLGLTLKS